MTSASPLVPVEDALRRIIGLAQPIRAVESIALHRAVGRTLASDLSALRTQPPLAVSAMDGYAVRARDLDSAPVRLTPIGESAAGRGFTGEVGAFETVRIFTGAPVPAGADSVLIQENAEPERGAVKALQGVEVGQYVRAAGQDFRRGERLLRAGRRLGASDIALAAAMNHPAVPCVRRPRVAILATGDELVAPGTEPGPAEIVASNSFALSALVEEAGGESLNLDIAPDDLGALQASFASAEALGADLLVTLGGASVGDHDLVRRALIARGMTLDFWRVAMRPGKPLMHGRLGSMQVLGLPGNPVSAIVCGILFVCPLVRALCGDLEPVRTPAEPARLAGPVPANDGRQDYLRGRLVSSVDALPEVSPGVRQDSSMLRALSEADCLIIRPPHAPAAPAGTLCSVIRLRNCAR